MVGVKPVVSGFQVDVASSPETTCMAQVRHLFWVVGTVYSARPARRRLLAKARHEWSPPVPNEPTASLNSDAPSQGAGAVAGHGGHGLHDFEAAHNFPGPNGLPELRTRSTRSSRSSARRPSMSMLSDASLDSYSRALRKGSKVDTFKKIVSEEASMAQSSPSACRRWCARIMGSQAAEVIFAMAILMNSITVGVELEWMAANPDAPGYPFLAANCVYAVVFLVEVVLGLIAFGPRQYFCSRGCLWNWLDVFVVSTSWAELVIVFFSITPFGVLPSGSLRMLRLIKVSRVARVLRVLRVVKIVHYIRPLRTLVHCVVDTTKSFVWALILLLLMIYVFAILFTDAVLDHLSDIIVTGTNPADIERIEEMKTLFGTVYFSISTLFQSISNGLDWGEAALVLSQVGVLWVLVYNLYIAFTSFVLLNVLTGVFCNSAIKAAESDHEMVIQSLIYSKKNFQELVENLFHRIDDLGLGMITISEFERHFNDVQVRAFFESLEMGAVDAWTLFASLDADGDNVISLQDFSERCVQLHGPARSVDLYSLKQLTAKLRQELQLVSDALLPAGDLRGSTRGLSKERGTRRVSPPMVATVSDEQSKSPIEL
ncbi:unnamed protein product [Durusdinium trenchii]|uniref:EF-hand domain-containing protein n=1 Tax=Durusdinium trenchii TaxID=1381693 RepID=A0ABP0HXY3_9DINO